MTLDEYILLVQSEASIALGGNVINVKKKEKI